MYRIPGIMRSSELLDNALRRASEIKKLNHPPPRKKGESKRLAYQKGLSSARINSVNDYITSRLRRYVRSFPSMLRIPDFYRELIDSHVSIDEIRKSLSRVSSAASNISAIASQIRRRIRSAGDVDTVVALRKQFYARVSSIMDDISEDLDNLIRIRNLMRQLPVIDNEMPTVVIAGAPNVGKSSLMNALSSAEVEVAVYPFTTKEVHVGVMEYQGHKIQLVDTPGLLDRKPEEQNPIEKRAAAAIRNLPDLVVFIIDPSGTCGKDLAAQKDILESLKSFIGDTSYIIAAGKSDLYDSPPELAEISFSTVTGEGLDDLKKRVIDSLGLGNGKGH